MRSAIKGKTPRYVGRRANWASPCTTAALSARSFNTEVCGSALGHLSPCSGHVFSTTTVVDDVALPRCSLTRRRATYHGVLYEDAEKRSIFRNCFTKGLIVKIVSKKGQITKKLPSGALVFCGIQVAGSWT